MLQRTKGQHCLGARGRWGLLFSVGRGKLLLLILKWMDFCIPNFWELRHKLRQKWFCRKGETKLSACVMLLCSILSTKITFSSIVMLWCSCMEAFNYRVVAHCILILNFIYVKIVSVARDEAANYRSTYGSPIPLKVSFQSIYFRSRTQNLWKYNQTGIILL